MRRIAPHWEVAPAKLSLTASTLHLWRWPLPPEATDDDLAPLSSAEQERAARMRHAGRRAAFIRCRQHLRRLLARYTGQAAEALVIAPDDHGKPQLVGAPFHFNLSHTDGWALLAVAQEPVGVDLESIRPRDLLTLAQRFFHPDEAAALQQARLDDQQPLFYRIWTAKEAYLKGIGTGLATPLASFTVPLHGSGPVTVADPTRPLPDWSTYPFLFTRDIMACVALATDTPIRRFQYFQCAESR